MALVWAASSSPSEGLGNFAGIGRPIAQPLADVTGASWRTYVTGDTGSLDAEAPSLRFGGYRLGGTSEFTTVSVEPGRNGTVAAGVWQTTTLTGSSEVWQTNATGGFCVQADPCTFAEFKTQYPNANLLGIQIAIGTAVEAISSYVDGVSLTIDGVTDTWNFELPAADSSTAVIGDPVLTDTGADVTIDLTASALAVGPVEFTIEVEGQPPQTITVDPGETTSITVSVPFGSTDIEVSAQGAVLAAATVTVTAAGPSASASAVLDTVPPTDVQAPLTRSQGIDARGFIVILGVSTLLALVMVRLRPTRPIR